jgi:hypothetical protein
MLTMSLDISKVEAQMKSVQDMMKTLNDGSVFNNWNRAIATVTANLTELRGAVNGISADLSKALGVKPGAGAGSVMPKDMAKSRKEVADVTLLLAKADEASAKADLAWANASTTASKTRVKNAKAETVANAELAASRKKVAESPLSTPASDEERNRALLGIGPNMGAPMSAKDQALWNQWHSQMNQRISAFQNALPGQVFQEQDKALRAETAAMAAQNKTIQESLALLNQRDALMRNSANIQAKAINSAGGVRGYAAQLMSDGRAPNMEQALAQSRQLSDYAEEYGAKIKNSTTFWDQQIGKFQSHLVQWGTWSVLIGTALAALDSLVSGATRSMTCRRTSACGTSARAI